MFHRLRLVAGLFTTVGLVLAMAGGNQVFATAGGNGNGNGNGNDTKTTICHRTASHTNPYVKITVDNNATNGKGGLGDHYNIHTGPIAPATGPDGKWGDIIPPVEGNLGQNWNDAGKAILDNRCRISNELWDTGITTTIFRSNGDPLGSPQPGVSVYDTANLTYDETTEIVPTGTVTYKFFNTIDATGASTTSVVNVDTAGNVPHSSTKGPLGAGSHSFVAVYSGDSNYKQATSAIEPLAVLKADPSISTTPDPTPSALVGATLNDSAKLQGGFSPTGTITFTLYDPSDTAAHSESVTVSGNNIYSTTTGHVAGTPGTWHWKAAYSGDANNNVVASVASDEPVVVTEGELRVQPTITTTPNPSSAQVGATLNDSATLAGGNDPQGTITFTLYDPSNAVAHTEEVSVDGNSKYSTVTGHVADSAGKWHWKAVYSGDTLNKLASSDPADEPVDVTAPPDKVQPAIATTPTPAKTTVGATLKDLATLSGGSNPTGTITFTLYDSSGTPVHIEQVSVSGNGSYQTPDGHVAGTQGTWHWKAEYSGDGANLPAGSDPADEPVVIDPAGGVLAATGFTSPAQALAAALMAIGLLAIIGALARRRREV